MDIFPEIMNDASFSTNEAILTSLRRAGEIIKSNQKSDYWKTDKGQAIMVGSSIPRPVLRVDCVLAITLRT